MKRVALMMLCLSTLPLFTSCQWLPGDRVVCTLYGDASCPEGSFCDPEPAEESDGVHEDLVGEHLCTEDVDSDYIPPDDDDSAGDDDDTTGDDDDDSAGDDDDTTGDDDDDSAGDDDDTTGDYHWNLWDPTVPGEALYSVSFPDGQTGCSQTPLGECHAWAVGTSGTVLHSADGGLSWHSQSIPDWDGPLNGVHFINQSTGWIVGDTGLLAWTVDGGTTWNQVIQFAAGENFNAVYSTNSQNVYIATSTGKVFFSNSGGQSNTGWTNNHNTASGSALLGISGSPDSQPKVWTVGDNGVALQVFGTNPPPTQTGLANSTNLHDVAVVNNEESWIVGEDGTLLYTDDHGQSWQTEDDELATNYHLYGVDFVSPERGWVVGGGTSIFRTTNSGFDWESEHDSFATTIANFPSNWPWLYDVDFTNPSVGIAVGNNGLILYARPDGFATGDDDDTTQSDDDDAAVNCDLDGDGFESTGSSCGGTDCRDGGSYAPFINPLAWDGPGPDGMGQSPADANCDGNPDHTEAEQTAFGIVPPASCADVDSKYVVGSGHGDFNGDSFEDLAFGNPSPTCGGSNGGRAVVLSSSETRGSVYGNGSTTQMNASTTARWVFQGPAGSETGHSVALGQFSSTSPGALLIGAPGLDMDGVGTTANGAVYLVLQAPTSAACALPGTSGSPCADFTIYGATEHERAGETVAWAGDITQDGYQEILIGAPGYGTESEGRFYLLDGQLIQTAMDTNATCSDPDGQAQLDCLNLWDLNSGASGHISIEGTQHAELGKVQPATGELDGNSRPDFVLSSASANTYSGAAYVFYGDNITSGSVPSIELDLGSSGGGGNQGSTADAQRTIYPPTVNTEFGASISLVPALNLDTDNYSELAIGAPAKNGDDGSAYIITSETINGGSSFNAITISPSNSTELGGKLNTGEKFGSTLAGGNLDGDSHGDLVVCAPLGGPPHSATYVSGAGTARLYRGATIDSLYNTNSSVVIATNDADVAFLGEVPDNPQRDGDSFCSSLNISVDADGAANNNNDVVIAAHHWSQSPCTSGCGGQGKAYVFSNPYIQGSGQP